MEVKPGNEVKIIIRPSTQNSTTNFAALGLNSEKENLNFIVEKNSELLLGPSINDVTHKRGKGVVQIMT